MKRRVRIEPEQRLHKREDSRGRPGLRRIRLWIQRWNWSLFSPQMSGKQFREPVVIEEDGRVELRAAEAFEVIVQAVAHEGKRKRAVFDRPDRSAVITVRVVRRVRRR